MAFQPGYGRTAVPARSSLIATTVAVAAVVAAGVFGASFIRLTGTPHRYGQNWSEQLNLQFAGIPAAEVRAALAAQPGVTGYAAGDYGQVSIGGQAIPAIGLDPLRGRGFLTLLAGRAPATGAEIALGEGTLRSLHLRLGQRVPVGAGHGARPMRIVGVATFARFSQASSAATDLGTGAVVPAAVLSLPSPPTCAGHVTCYNFVLIRYRRGTSLRAAAARLAATVDQGRLPARDLPADRRPAARRDPQLRRGTGNAAGARPGPGGARGGHPGPGAAHQRPPPPPRPGGAEDPRAVAVAGAGGGGLAGGGAGGGRAGRGPAARRRWPAGGRGRCSPGRPGWPAMPASRRRCCCSRSRRRCWPRFSSRPGPAGRPPGPGRPRSCGRSERAE